MEPQEQAPITTPEKKFTLSTPMAIIIAGVLIALAVFLTNSNGISNKNEVKKAETPKLELRSDDHINGNISKAKVIMFEYSDSDCPFCERFHPTLKQIKSEYGDSVAWVYRHYPIQGLHPYAPFEALALECVADSAGNDAFWQYLDKIYSVNLSASKEAEPDQGIFTKLATEVGVNANEFKKCYDERKFQDRISSDASEGVSLGAKGTPFTIIMNKKTGEKIDIPGAYPIEEVRKAIDSLMK